MPESVATAFVDIRPNLLGFEAELSAGLRGALGGVAPSTGGFTKAAAGQTALATATRRTTKALSEQAEVMQVESTQLARFSRGAAATGLSLFGLRGATLAASSGFLAGAAALTALAKSVATATSFNSQLAVFAATTGATSEQMARVSEASKALGRDLTLPGVSASDAAVAMTELAKAGLSVEDAIAGARGVLQLGTAANISFAEATTIAANAINAFNLQGRDAGHVADVLANAANAAQGSIVDIGVAFQQAAAVGHQVGLTFEDTTVFLTSLAKAGLTSSDAGTSLRTALIRLINPTKKTQELFHSLGLELRDASGNLRPEFFVELGNALAGMTKQQRDATLAQIGGQDAVRALAILSKQSIGQLLALRKELQQQGTAADVAKARLTGLAGAGANLQNTIEGFALSLGQKATPSLVAATNAITGFITATAQSPAIGLLGQTIHTTADAVGALAGALGAVAPVLGTFIGLAASIASAIGPGVILASVAGFLVFNKALSASTLGLRLFLAELSTSIALGGGLRAATALMAESLVGFATSATGVTIALTAVTAGVIFLATRDSQLERAQKALRSSTDDLAKSYEALHAAQQTQLSAEQTVRSDEQAAANARQAVTAAEAARQTLDAGASATKRKAAEDRLRVALQDLDVAEQQLAQDRRALADSNRVLENEERKNAERRAADIQKVIDLQDELARNARTAAALAAQAPPGSEKTFLLADAAKREKQAIDDLTVSLRKNASELRNRDNATGADINLAERFEAVARFNEKFRQLNPTVLRVLLNADNVKAGLKDLEESFRESGQTALANFAHALRTGAVDAAILAQAQNALHVWGVTGTKSGLDFTTNLHRSLLAGAQQAAAAAAAVAAGVRLAFLNGIKALANQTSTLFGQVTDLEIAGASPQERLAAARRAQARADAERARADAALKRTPRGEPEQRAVEKAREDQVRARSEVASIEAEIASDAQQAASNAKTAADKRAQAIADAKAAKDKADQAFLDLLSGKRGAFDLRFAIAQGTKTLSDDISAQQAFTGELTREIAAIRRSALSEADKAAAIQQLRVERQRSINATRDLVTTQNAAARQAIIDRRDRAQEALELDVQIAELGKNKGKELKAHQALLRFLIERRKHTGEASIERKRLTLEIEREKATIADLQKATKSRNDALKALEFTFLQTQSGFVANLLGNLLPTGSVAGTLGGGAISTAAPTVPSASFGTAVHQRPPDVPAAAFATAVHQRGKIDAGFQAASQTGATAGASFGQLSVLITIAREQLAVLRAATGQKAHPEAAVQRSVQNAASDILPW